MSLYGRIIRSFYDRAGFEIFMHPVPYFQIPRSIGYLVGGQMDLTAGQRLRIGAFGVLCRLQSLLTSLRPSHRCVRGMIRLFLLLAGASVLCGFIIRSRRPRDYREAGFYKALYRPHAFELAIATRQIFGKTASQWIARAIGAGYAIASPQSAD
jgi:hypothetical protein